MLVLHVLKNCYYCLVSGVKNRDSAPFQTLESCAFVNIEHIFCPKAIWNIEFSFHFEDTLRIKQSDVLVFDYFML